MTAIIGGAILGGIGSYKSAKAQKKASQSQQAQALENERIAKKNARDVQLSGAKKEKKSAKCW